MFPERCRRDSPIGFMCDIRFATHDAIKMFVWIINFVARIRGRHFPAKMVANKKEIKQKIQQE